MPSSLWHHNARQHTRAETTTEIRRLGFGLSNCPPYGPDWCRRISIPFPKRRSTSVDITTRRTMTSQDNGEVLVKSPRCTNLRRQTWWKAGECVDSTSYYQQQQIIKFKNVYCFSFIQIIVHSHTKTTPHHFSALTCSFVRHNFAIVSRFVTNLETTAKLWDNENHLLRHLVLFVCRRI
jgi:hypothetical protein